MSLKPSSKPFIRYLINRNNADESDEDYYDRPCNWSSDFEAEATEIWLEREIDRVDGLSTKCPCCLRSGAAAAVSHLIHQINGGSTGMEEHDASFSIDCEKDGVKDWLNDKFEDYCEELL